MLKEVIILTLIIECILIIGRLIFGSMKETFNKHKDKLKVRIHHGYIGVILVLVYLSWAYSPLLIVGMSLLLSDLIHHFIVLPLWVGRTEFP